MSEKAILPLQSEGICSTAHNPSATLFFFKKPPGSEPHRKQHLQARVSTNTDLDLFPWKRLWVTSKFTSCLALKNNLSLYYPSWPIQGSKGPSAPQHCQTSISRIKASPAKHFYPGVLFKECQGGKQTFSFTIQEPVARKPMTQFAAAKPNQNMDAFQSLHLFF